MLTRKDPKQAEAKRDDVINPQIFIRKILMLSKRYESHVSNVS